MIKSSQLETIDATAANRLSITDGRRQFGDKTISYAIFTHVTRVIVYSIISGLTSGRVREKTTTKSSADEFPV